jgi:hypothetical protein
MQEQALAKEWIDNLAEDIRQRNHEAAEDFGSQQHYAGIISTRGKEFFVVVVSCLQENIDALRSRLQGDPASSETALQTIKADEVQITRARFPWVDARLTHHADTITLDYAKSPGAAGDPGLNRKSRAFVLQVQPDETLFVQDAFAEPPQKYEQAKDLARYITELLFGE